MASVLTVAVSAVFMITQFVEVNDSLSAMKTAQKQYAFEEAVTAQKAFELEQSIDLSKIEQEATVRLRMQRPDSHQIVYIDIPQEDVTEKTSGEVEGFKNRIQEWFTILPRTHRQLWNGNEYIDWEIDFYVWNSWLYRFSGGGPYTFGGA